MIIGSNIIFRENLPSTNTYIADILRSDKPSEGTIIHTNHQSAGRGQAGNRWESEDGKNLLISILLFPSMIHATDQFLISMAISLGICDFLNRYATGFSIKWPNDIYIGNDKIAGILIENSILGDQIESTIAGIGLNINQEQFVSDAPNPISLKLITGKNYDLTSCLNDLAFVLDKRYKQLIAEDLEQIRQEYILKLFRLKDWHTFRDKDGNYTGRILSVTDYGRLQIETRRGRLKEYSYKEVEFIL